MVAILNSDYVEDSSNIGLIWCFSDAVINNKLSHYSGFEPNCLWCNKLLNFHLGMEFSLHGIVVKI